MIRKVFSIIDKSDVVIEVLDAREPDLTRSRVIEGFAEKRGKKLLLAINKGDLVPREVSEKWKEYFRRQGLRAVYMSATGHMGTMVLRREIKRLLQGKEGIVCFVGYPKTGKSSIINALKGKHSATTSVHPMDAGYTKAPQLFKIDSKIYAWDTPGVVPPDGDLLERIIRGSSVDDMEDPVRAAVLLIKRIEEFDRKSLERVYGEYSDPYDLLTKIALKRGWIYKKDREPNIEEAARALIREYHEGKIIYFSLPPREVDEDESSNIRRRQDAVGSL